MRRAVSGQLRLSWGNACFIRSCAPMEPGSTLQGLGSRSTLEVGAGVPRALAARLRKLSLGNRRHAELDAVFPLVPRRCFFSNLSEEWRGRSKAFLSPFATEVLLLLQGFSLSMALLPAWCQGASPSSRKVLRPQPLPFFAAFLSRLESFASVEQARLEISQREVLRSISRTSANLDTCAEAYQDSDQTTFCLPRRRDHTAYYCPIDLTVVRGKTRRGGLDRRFQGQLLQLRRHYLPGPQLNRLTASSKRSPPGPPTVRGQ